MASSDKSLKELRYERALHNDIDKEIKDLERKDKHTEKLIEQASNGNLDKATLKEILREEEIEVREIRDIANAMRKAEKITEDELRMLENRIAQIIEAEKTEDRELQDIKKRLRKLESGHISQKELEQLPDEFVDAAARLQKEARAEKNAGKLAEEVGKQLDHQAAEERRTAEEVREEEEILEAVKNIDFKDTEGDQEVMHGTEEDLRKIDHMTLEEAEALQEQARKLEKAASHTGEEAKMLVEEVEHLGEKAKFGFEGEFWEDRNQRKREKKGLPEDLDKTLKRVENAAEQAENTAEKASEEAEQAIDEAQQAEESAP